MLCALRRGVATLSSRTYLTLPSYLDLLVLVYVTCAVLGEAVCQLFPNCTGSCFGHNVCDGITELVKNGAVRCFTRDLL